MRIANSTIVRNYTSNLNNNLSRLNEYNMKVTTQRKFTSMAEDTAAGVRAMKVRRSMAQLESYADNSRTMKATLTSAEGNLMQISSLSHEASAKFVSAMNGDKGEGERKIIASELKKTQEALLACVNGQYSDQYLFGGTNTTSAPFTLDDAKDLCYNGVKVKDIADANGQVKQEYQYLMDDAAFVDIGMGLTMNDQELQGNSAFESTMNGLDFLGVGDKNLYLVLGEMIDMLETGSMDMDGAGKLLDQFRASSNNVNIQITELGAKASYIDFTIDRLDAESISLKERQNALEIIDPADAIMDFKVQEYVYNAALQMGQRLLQPTLFSFMS